VHAYVGSVRDAEGEVAASGPVGDESAARLNFCHWAFEYERETD
jgi:hypothetical protein